jgi:copper(I)-binding protein
MDITTDVDDTLTSVEVSPTIAETAELHVTEFGSEGEGHHDTGDTDASDTDASDTDATDASDTDASDTDDTVSMTEVEELALQPGEPFAMTPGASHIMLVDLAAPLIGDERFVVTLKFGSGRTLDVDVVVANNPPT